MAARRYRVLLPLKVHTGTATYEQHDEFDHEFTQDEETENVRSGLLAIVACRYRVVGGSEVHGTQPGSEFEMALPMGNEALLVEGGHIERVETPAKAEKTKPARKEGK